jgi:uncharacterized protein (TIGR02266 family)
VSPEQEFKTLNAKVLDGSASNDERQRWKQLRDQLRTAKVEEDEPRRHERSTVSVDVAFQDDSELIRAVSSDLGAGGLCLQLDGSYEPGRSFRLNLTLPDSEQPIEAGARVAWAAAGHVGLEFTDLPDAVRDRIDALVWEEIDLSDL